MALDIFKNYGLDKINDKKSLNESYDLSPIDNEWKQVATKTVRDSNGFLTEYTWYTNGEKHIFMFGDSDLTEPDEGWADWECETEERAQEWFDSYTGFEDDEDDDFDLWECSDTKEAFFDRGFNKAYGIELEETLTEAYQNLPTWLTNYLDNTADGKSIKKVLNNRHIDLYKATYIKGSIPSNQRDPAFRDQSKLTIFRLSYPVFGGHTKEGLYIPGVNDPYLHMSSQTIQVSKLPRRELLKYVIEYGYLDLNDDRNLNFTTHMDRRVARQQAKDLGVYREPENGLHPVEVTHYSKEDGKYTPETVTKWVTAKGYDKSGYPLDPDKYVKKLNNVGLDNYGNRLIKLCSQIEALQGRLATLIPSLNVEKSLQYKDGGFMRNAYGLVQDIVNSIGRAIDSFNSLKQSIDDILTYDDSTDELKAKFMSRRFMEYGSRIKEYCDQANKALIKLEQYNI